MTINPDDLFIVALILGLLGTAAILAWAITSYFLNREEKRLDELHERLADWTYTGEEEADSS
jgi:hypothetical protein